MLGALVLIGSGSAFVGRTDPTAKISRNGHVIRATGPLTCDIGERLSLRRLAHIANVPKDFVYRLDAGEARYIDLDALTRLCETLHCRVEDILTCNADGREPV